MHSIWDLLILCKWTALPVLLEPILQHRACNPQPLKFKALFDWIKIMYINSNVLINNKYKNVLLSGIVENNGQIKNTFLLNRSTNLYFKSVIFI